MAISADTPREICLSGPDAVNHLAVAASTLIYLGSLVGDNGSGLARKMVQGDPFLGVALERADNSSGSASAIAVEVAARGVLKGLTIAGASDAGSVGEICYCSDDGTFTLTSTSNTAIGRVSRFDAARSTFDVSFCAITHYSP